MNYWLRLYTNVLDDPKVQLLSDKDFRRWINLLCLAKEHDGTLPDLCDVAWRLRIDEEECASLLNHLTSKGLLDKNGNMLSPHNWSKRQFSEDRKCKAPEESDYKGNYIYFIGTTLDRPVKVGISKNPWARCSELQTASPDKLSLLGIFRARIGRDSGIHQILKDFRQQGEWFALPVYLQEVIAQAVADKDNYGQLEAKLRAAIRSSTTELRSESTTLLQQRQSRDRDRDRAEAETEAAAEAAAEAIACPSAAAAKSDFAKSQASHFSRAEIEQFIIETKPHVRNPGGLATGLLRTGEEDPAIARWKARRLAETEESQRLEERLRENERCYRQELENFDWDGWVTTCIESGWIGQLECERGQILNRGGPVADWEQRVIAYFNN